MSGHRQALADARSRSLQRDDSGTTTVELALVLAVFLLIFLGLIDFGRLGYSSVMAEKAMQRAARIAAVRPPVCDAFYTLSPVNLRVSGTTEELGTPCRNGVCVSPAEVSCTLADATTTAGIATRDEIWSSIRALRPHSATMADVRLIYAPDPNGDLGFLGGPYIPLVTAELVTDDPDTTPVEGPTFTFVSPLGGLVALAGGQAAGGFSARIPYPPMSISLPGEDLNIGDSG